MYCRLEFGNKTYCKNHLSSIVILSLDPCSGENVPLYICVSQIRMWDAGWCPLNSLIRSLVKKHCNTWIVGVVRWCEGVVYLMSQGRPTDIGLQLGKACYPCSIRVEGDCFYFFCFFTLIPVPLSSLFLSFISSTISSIILLPFSGRRHKMTHKGWRVIKPKHNQSIHESQSPASAQTDHIFNKWLGSFWLVGTYHLCWDHYLFR